MTEAEWLACAKPLEMLAHLRGRCSDRKLRLFACACCRRVWHRLTDGMSRRAVEVAERHADGAASAAELEAAWRDAERFFGQTCTYGTSSGDQYARAASAAAEPISFLPRMYQFSFRYVGEEWPAHAALLRDLFGNPFRPAAVDPSWLTATVVEVARGIYEEQAFDRLPVLADALLDAGCDDVEILTHCRSEGSHVRGWWVVDLVLGKE